MTTTNMKPYVTRTANLLFCSIASLFLLSGCGGSGSAGSPTSTPIVNANSDSNGTF